MNLRQVFLFLLIIVSGAPGLKGQNCPVEGITAGEYAARRQALITLLDSSSVFVMRAPEAASEYEQMHYRQDLDFLYLTGVKSPGYTLLIMPRGITLGGKQVYSLLFAPAAYLGEINTFSGSEVPHRSFSGTADTVIVDDAFRKIFQQVMTGAAKLYYSAPGLSFVHDWLNDKPYFLEKDINKRLKINAVGLKIAKASTLVSKLRQIKSPAEVDLIRKAINMTGDGIEKAMADCKPGIWEYQIQADIEFAMTNQGAACPSFPSIVGTGKNSLSPHYMSNHCQALDGEVMVMDVGAEYLGYAADITRTIPVSGKFSKAQREVYSTVLKVQDALINMIRPGVTMSEIDRKAVELISDAGYKKYNIHGVTHPVGLDVHDVYSSDTLQPGMVITIEPGLYIPEGDTLLPPAFRMTGMRIEDDILVTPTGHEVLSEGIPKTISDIERRMK
jgi:Xaa-Pro aminopeptidase